MRLGYVRLEYLDRGGAKTRLEGALPLADGRVRLEPFNGPGEIGVRVEKAEPRLRLLGLELELRDANLRDRFLANGFQSWSETELLGPDDRLGGLRLLGFLKPYGDYDWVGYPGRPGRFHSHWLTYTVDAGTAPDAVAAANSGHGPGGRPGAVTFLGSLNEATAYTVFRIDYRAGRLWAEVDVDGMVPAPGDVLAHIFHAEGGPSPGSRRRATGLGAAGSGASQTRTGEGSPLLPIVRSYAARLAEVWKDELAAVRVKVPSAERGDEPEPGPGTLVPRLAHRPGGWNSWYNYYNKVTRQDILAETATLRAAGLALDFVQIDDGWQAEVGDWLGPSPRFLGTRGVAEAAGARGVGARGMKDLASAIRDAGFAPGLWVAPFVASKRAEVFRRGWIQPWKAGWNITWNSSVYALDLDRPEVTDYVRRVGDTFHDWGFDLIKADFLYAAGVRPWGGKTRAQRMREALRLLRQATPGRLLGCGVPLASAAGLCDFCRLGADTTPKWEDGLLSFARYRERPSTLGALRTVLNRWFMDGTLFILDPDVFLFGPGRLTGTERRTIYDVLTTVGGMQSFSDSVGRLDPEAAAVVKRTFPLPPLEVRAVEENGPDFFTVTAERGGHPLRLRVNLSDAPQAGLLPRSSSFA